MDIEVLRRQNDEQAKRIRELEEQVRILEAAADRFMQLATQRAALEARDQGQPLGKPWISR